MTQNMYTAIGGDFEYLNSDCGYEKWSQYLIDVLLCENAGKAGVDFGCGNGYFTRALYRAGYKVTGVDISPQMLSKAVELARAEGIAAEFLLGDITKLKLSGLNFAVAINDCVNYIPQKNILKAFKNVFSCLKKGGVFIFDISSEQKLKSKVGDNTFFKDFEEESLIWCNELKEDRVEMEITLFRRQKSGLYERFDECQTQYIHKKEQIISALSSAGFSVRTEGHLGGGEEERINFICKKP